MNNIQELKKQIDELYIKNNHLQLHTIQNILVEYNGTDWKKYVNIKSNLNSNYNKQFITHGYNKLYDIYIITWYNKIESKIHNHSENGCIMKLLYGNLNEKIYDKNMKLINKRNISEKYVTYIHDNIGFHSIQNNSEDYSVSLHIYSPANFKTTYFN